MSNRIADLEKIIISEIDPYKKIDFKILLAWELNTVNVERMHVLVEEIESDLQNSSYEKGVASCLSLKAMYAVKKDLYFEALEFADIAYESFIALNNIEGQIRTLRILSIVYGQLGKFDDCLNVCRKGLALIAEHNAVITEENNTPIEFTLLNNIAATYSYLGRHAEALDFQLQAYEYLKLGDEGSAQVLFLCNLGQSYIENNNAELALEYLNKGLAEATRLSLESYYYHLCYSGLGLVYERIGNHELAMKNLLMSLAHAESSSSKYGQVEVLILLGKVSLKTNQISVAIDYLEKSLELAEEIKANELLRETYLLLAECFELEKNYETSIFHYKRHLEVYRDVISLELEQKMSEYTTDFKIEQAKKDAEIYKLKNIELKEKNEEIASNAKALEESYHHISTLSLIGQEITASLDIEKILNTIYDNLKTLMDVNIFGIGSYEESIGIIDYLMFIEESVRLPREQASIENSNSYAARCIKSKKLLIFNDLTLDSEYKTASSVINTNGRSPLSLVYYPLILGDKIIGTITVQSYRENAYTSFDIDAIRILASYISIALNNSQKSAELQKAVDELEVFSKTDPLTELFNRRYMTEKITEECEKYKKLMNKFSIVITDIDFFKNINDTYGHDCGDHILKELSELLKLLLRKQDYLARWGGEEFLILLTETDGCGGAVIAERLRKSIMDTVFKYNGNEIGITMTFGVSEYNNEPSMDDTIKRADKALYFGKETGRNKCVINGLPCHIDNIYEM